MTPQLLLYCQICISSSQLFMTLSSLQVCSTTNLYFNKVTENLFYLECKRSKLLNTIRGPQIALFPSESIWDNFGCAAYFPAEMLWLLWYGISESTFIYVLQVCNCLCYQQILNVEIVSTTKSTFILCHLISLLLRPPSILACHLEEISIPNAFLISQFVPPRFLSSSQSLSASYPELRAEKCEERGALASELSF